MMVFWWIGIYATLLWAYNNWLESLLELLWGCIRSTVRGEKLSERYGPWAVITGATDGIGKCYAQNLAAKGLNIALISRSKQKLDSVGDEIERKFSVQTARIVVDFDEGGEIYERLRDQLAAIDIGIFVNNVGFLPPLTPYDECAEKDLGTVVNLNVVAATMLTRLVLPGMRQRGRGIVVNIASSSGHLPTPCMAAYGASKAYLISLGLALRHELRGTGVEVQTVAPSLVRTNLSQHYESKMPWYVTVLTAEQVARFGVFSIGKTSYTSGHWQHCLQACWWAFLPLTLGIRVIGKILGQGVHKAE